MSDVDLLPYFVSPETTKSRDHRTVGLIAHGGKGTRDAIGMLRIISERNLDTDEELCACFIDWQKAFDLVNWTKLIQILKGTGID